ncbi:MAG: endoribonuclease MazF [bacterium]|nr:endoribonuclease MazF [bacterium]
MVAAKYIPRRGDIVWIDFDPTRGHEQSGRRPAIVVSPEAYNKISNRALFCPITSQSKGYIFEVVLEGKDITGAILVDQIRTLDWSKRRIVFIEKAPLASMDDVEAKLLTLIRQ